MGVDIPAYFIYPESRSESDCSGEAKKEINQAGTPVKPGKKGPIRRTGKTPAKVRAMTRCPAGFFTPDIGIVHLCARAAIASPTIWEQPPGALNARK